MKRENCENHLEGGGRTSSESGQIKESGTIDFKVESEVVSHLSVRL